MLIVLGSFSRLSLTACQISSAESFAAAGA